MKFCKEIKHLTLALGWHQRENNDKINPSKKWYKKKSDFIIYI